MSDNSTIRKISLLDKEWREQKSAGITITKTIRYPEITGTGEEIVEIEVPIRVLSGTEHTLIQDLILEKDEDGRFVESTDGTYVRRTDPDGSLSEAAFISVSTGLSMQDVDKLKRKKSRGFWTALVNLSMKYNGVTKAEVDEEKNEDSQAVTSPG